MILNRNRQKQRSRLVLLFQEYPLANKALLPPRLRELLLIPFNLEVSFFFPSLFVDTLLTERPTSSNAGPSSLSTLANALEKLKMPPPPRPNTSMGFNRDNDGDKSSEIILQSQDDSTLTKSQLDRKSRVSSVRRPGTFQELDATKRKSVFGPPAKGLLFGSGTLMSTGLGRGRPPQRVSRQPTLPSVMASPVKGGATLESDTELEIRKEKNPKPSVQFVTTDLELAELIKSSASRTTKETVDAWRKNASKRASLASHALNQSLTALSPPVPAEPELEEPVVTPPRRQGLRSSTSSSHPSSTEVSSSKPAPSKIPEQPGVPSLTVLSDCKIFVDIKTATGEDAADLFVDMLRGLGARVRLSFCQPYFVSTFLPAHEERWPDLYTHHF